MLANSNTNQSSSIVYLTFADQPSGIYRSQVEDFVLYLSSQTTSKVYLVSFISLKKFWFNRALIRENVPKAIVVPMVPRLQNWALNRFLLYILCFFLKPRLIYSRSVLATLLAINCRDKNFTKEVIYDGRGAIAAEWNEYNVVPDKILKQKIHGWEANAIIKSDTQIAVSSMLVKYWEKEYGYIRKNTFVVPCTLSKSYIQNELTKETILTSRKLIDASENDLVLVYSGSVAGWQSVNKLFSFVGNILQQQENTTFLFLGKETEQISRLKKKFTGRVHQLLVKPEEVHIYLKGCDYGLLIREESVTNTVASPVKFAEYLACGLKVIASHGIGDYSTMIHKHSIGYFYDALPEQLVRSSMSERTTIRDLALSNFTKDHYRGVYSKINELRN